MQQKEILQAGGNVPARQLNMELMRVVSMMLVLLVHACFLSVWPMREYFVASPAKAVALTYGESVALVCVNCFILISGYFAIRPKLKSLLNLLFLIFFYKIVIYAVDFTTFGYNQTHLVAAIYPFTDWFVGAYLGLYLLSPILNRYIESAPEKEFRTFLIIFLIIQVTFGWMPFDWNTDEAYYFLNFNFMDFSCGYSVLAFIGLYCLARYIRLHGEHFLGGVLGRWKARDFLLLFLAIAVVNAAMYVFSRVYISDIKLSVYICQLFVRYNNPLTVAQSVCLLCFFIKLRVRSDSPAGPMIVTFGRSAFAVYLIHFNYLLLPYFKQAAKYLYHNLPVWGWVPAILLYVIAIYVVCVLIDQVRLAVWRAISPRK